MTKDAVPNRLYIYCSIFFTIDGALKVLGKEVEFVEGAEAGYVETVGSPEYACYLNDYMAIIQGMLC